MTRRLTLLVILVTLALPGCDISPTEIVGGPLTLEGTLTNGSSDPHLVVITSSGGVRIEALSITADPPLAEGVTPSIGLRLGETDSEGLLCIASFTTTLREGDNLAIGLEVREYCLELFDNGTIMEDSSRSYVVQVRSSE